jgi:hypothetical protein
MGGNNSKQKQQQQKHPDGFKESSSVNSVNKAPEFTIYVHDKNALMKILALLSSSGATVEAVAPPPQSSTPGNNSLLWVHDEPIARNALRRSFDRGDVSFAPYQDKGTFVIEQETTALGTESLCKHLISMGLNPTSCSPATALGTKRVWYTENQKQQHR